MKNKIDRTTRLLVTLTIFGATWYLLKGALNLWLTSFSENAYTETFLTFEHILSITILTVVFAITTVVIRYIYYELKTYQYFVDDESRINVLEKADVMFGKIFLTIKHSFNLSIIFGLITLVIMVFFQPNLLISLLVGVFIVLGLVVFLSFFKKEKVYRVVKYSQVIEQKVSPYLYQIYIACLFLLLGTAVTLISLSSDKLILVNIEENSSLPIEIKMTNINDPIVQITIINGNKLEEKKILKFHESDLYISFEEVFDNKRTFYNKAESLLYIKKSKYTYLLKYDLIDYVAEGKNSIEIVIKSSERSSDKTIRVLSNIIKEGNDLYISEKNFSIDL